MTKEFLAFARNDREYNEYGRRFFTPFRMTGRFLADSVVGMIKAGMTDIRNSCIENRNNEIP